MQNSQQQQRLKHRLETQSRLIERIFARHQLPAQIIGGTTVQGETRFDLRTQLESGLEKLKTATSEIRTVLGAAEVGLDGRNGRYRLQLDSEPDPQTSLLDVLELVSDWPGVTAVLGLTESGSPLLLDFRDANTAHVLISGDPGSGKTALLRTIALGLSLIYRQSRLQLIIVSDCGYGGPDRQLDPLQLLPHMLAPTAHSVDEAADIMSFLVDELDYRRQQQIDTPAIVLMVDEVVGLTQLDEPGLVEMITQLALHGASSGIHLVLTTECPEVAPMDKLLRSSLPVRIVGQFGDGRRAEVAAGYKEPVLNYLAGQGEFAAVIDSGRPNLFQSAYVSDYDLHRCLQEMQRSRPRPILAQPVNERELRYGQSQLREQAAFHESGFVYDGQEVALTGVPSSVEEYLVDDAFDDESVLEEE